ncbi:MAG: carbohydrate-binding domain-containing protein, partial [Oscillospiraceae bacterium]|nr:carbohydrate-binding domain-containing protein [Oscillospiraceae bacterium]
MKRSISFALVLAMALSAPALSGCSAAEKGETGETGGDGAATEIVLSDSGVTVNGAAAPTDTSAAVYTASDIVYYEAGRDFTYGEGTEADEHSQTEADAHTVVHITQPGTYSLSGTLSAGQIAVDLGDGAEEDPGAVVTLILNGVDITCTVAPAVIFYSVYECGTADEETASKDVDTSAAGANVVIADGTVNSVTGSYVARIYKPESVELTEDGAEVADAKKLHKYDGAFYSKMSMNVDGGEQGTGVLHIDAENEGLDSELHLTINGGVINIESGNDGINTNEDNVSVTTVNGGTLTIRVTGETGEGDGIDSNGWLVINGGTIVSAACSDSMDAGLDADMGIEINGGTVAATGNMYDQIDGGAQNYAVFSFASRQSGGTEYTLKDAGGQVLGTWTPANDFTYLVVSMPGLEEGTCTLWQGETQLAGSVSVGGMGGPGMGGGPRPDGGTAPAEGFEPP